MQAWNGISNPALLPGVSQRLQRITQQLSTADPSMDGTLLTYYSMSDRSSGGAGSLTEMPGAAESRPLS